MKNTVLAITAKEMARIGEIELINDHNDFIFALDRKLMAAYNHAVEPNTLLETQKRILSAIYNVFALESKIILSFSCTQDSNNKDIFHLNAVHNNQPLSFKVDLSIDPTNKSSKYLNDFIEAYKQISALTPVHTQEQQQRPRVSSTVILWGMRTSLLIAFVGVTCFILALAGVLNDPIIAGVVLPVASIASALLVKRLIDPGLVGEGDDIGDLSAVTTNNSCFGFVSRPKNDTQNAPGFFTQYSPFSRKNVDTTKPSSVTSSPSVTSSQSPTLTQ